jgi:hypothetical protein
MQSELPHPRRSRFAPIFQRSVKVAKQLLRNAAEPLIIYKHIISNLYGSVNKNKGLY